MASTKLYKTLIEDMLNDRKLVAHGLQLQVIEGAIPGTVGFVFNLVNLRGDVLAQIQKAPTVGPGDTVTLLDFEQVFNVTISES